MRQLKSYVLTVALTLLVSLVCVQPAYNSGDAEVARKRNYQHGSEMVRNMPVDVTKLRNYQHSEMTRTMPVDLTKLRNYQFCAMSDFVPFIEVRGWDSYTVTNTVYGAVSLTSHGGFSNCTTDFQIMSFNGSVIHKESQNVSLFANLETQMLFTWHSGDLPLGNYYSRFIVTDQYGFLAADTGWCFGFQVSEPVLSYDFGSIEENSFEDCSLSLNLVRGQQMIFGFSLATWINYLEIRLGSNKGSAFCIEVGNETLQQKCSASVLNGTCGFRINTIPKGTYSIRLTAISPEARPSRLLIHASQKANPDLSYKLFDETSAIERIEGISGVTRAFNLVASYHINTTEQIELSIRNQTGHQIYLGINNTSLFGASNSISFFFEYSFPTQEATSFLSFSLTLRECGKMLQWTLPMVSKKPQQKIDLRYNVTDYYKMPVSLNFREKNQYQRVGEDKLEALEVAGVKIIDVGVDGNTLRNVTISLQAKNTYFSHFMWFSGYVYYDLFVSPVRVGTKETSVWKALVVYGETEKVIVKGIPVAYENGLPKVRLSIEFRKSVPINILDWVLKKGLKFLVPNFPADDFGRIAMDTVHAVVDFFRSTLTVDDMKEILYSDITPMIESELNFLLLRSFGTLDLNRILGCMFGYSLVMHVIDNEPGFAWRIAGSLIRLMLKTFQQKPWVLEKIIADAIWAVAGRSWNSFGLIRERVSQLLLVFDIVDAAFDAGVKLLAPDSEKKEIIAGLAEPLPGEFQDVSLADPLLQVDFSGNLSDSLFDMAHLYSIQSLQVDVSKSANGNASFCLGIDPSAGYKGDFVSMFSDPDVRSSFLAFFGIITSSSQLSTDGEALIVVGNGEFLGCYNKFSVNMTSEMIFGFLQQSFGVPVIDNTCYVDIPMIYPFGTNLTYNVSLTLPFGSSDICVVSNSDYTIQNTTIAWQSPVINVNVTFSPPIILNVDFYKSVISQGQSTSVNVTVENRGSNSVTYNITTCIETTIVNQTRMTIGNGTSETVTILWNSAEFAKGNHTISVYGVTAEDETDIIDSWLSDGWIIISIVGDVDGNFVVNILDLVKITGIYGMKLGDLQFYPNSDLEEDGIINNLDVVRCTDHYGERYP